MSCPWCERWLQTHWEGTASPVPPPELTAHWAASPRCRQEAALAARCREVCPSPVAVLPPKNFSDQVLSRVRQERRRSTISAWTATLAALLLATVALGWTVLHTPHGPTPPLAQQPRITPQPTTPRRNPIELAHLQRLVGPLEGAKERTFHLTKQMALEAEERVRRLLPRWETIDLPPVEDPWSASVLPVRVVREAASAGFDPLASSTREAYQTVKQYLPPLPRKKMAAMPQ